MVHGSEIIGQKFNSDHLQFHRNSPVNVRCVQIRFHDFFRQTRKFLEFLQNVFISKKLFLLFQNVTKIVFFEIS